MFLDVSCRRCGPARQNSQETSARIQESRRFGNARPFVDVGATSTSAILGHWSNRFPLYPADYLAIWPVWRLVKFPDCTAAWHMQAVVFPRPLHVLDPGYLSTRYLKREAFVQMQVSPMLIGSVTLHEVIGYLRAPTDFKSVPRSSLDGMCLTK